MYSIHAHLLPSVSSYDEARRVYDRATEFSPATSVAYKWPSNIRGLRGRRDTSKTVFVDSDGAVNFQYHHHVMVKWVSPTEVHVLCYDSRSSVEFADAFLPTGLCARGAVMRVNGYRAMSGYLKFHKQETGWEPDLSTITPEFQLALDRKVAAQVRKVFAPFFEWRQAFNALLHRSEEPYGAVTFGSAQAAGVYFAAGGVPEEDYANFYRMTGPINERLLLRLYAICGAIKREPLPPGTPPRKTKYDDFTAFVRCPTGPDI